MYPFVSHRIRLDRCRIYMPPTAAFVRRTGTFARPGSDKRVQPMGHFKPSAASQQALAGGFDTWRLRYLAINTD